MTAFRDPRGVYHGEDGAAQLELLLLRREIDAAQRDLMRKRAEQRGLEKIQRRELAEVIPLEKPA